MVTTIAVIAAVWCLSVAGGLFTFTMWKLLKKAWAEELFIICLIVFFGLPVVLMIAFIFGLTDVFTEFLKSLISESWTSLIK